MSQTRRASWRCELGLHKWRDLGESVKVTWTEPSPGMTRLQMQWRPVVGEVRFDQGSRKVFTERECLRCGIAMKRKIVTNSDGTLSCVGWEQLPRRTVEADEQSREQSRRLVRYDFRMCLHLIADTECQMPKRSGSLARYFFIVSSLTSVPSPASEGTSK